MVTAQNSRQSAVWTRYRTPLESFRWADTLDRTQKKYHPVIIPHRQKPRFLPSIFPMTEKFRENRLKFLINRRVYPGIIKKAAKFKINRYDLLKKKII